MKKARYRFYLDAEKEEKWINEMAEEGWNLKTFTLGWFTFIKGEPGTFIYRNEFISGMSKEEKNEYFEILKDSGVTIVDEFGGWVYMKKAAGDGPFDLYTDTSSKIDYSKRMLNMFFLLFFINAWMGVMNIGVFEHHTMTAYINSAVGILNAAVALLIAVPIIKIMRRIRELKEKKQFFE
ncbi:DUF2812 domain-containing protein [Bacillus infantis]|uniref:DUF2812 domain-containing protein n=1 Tax=Bacillus infantis TaxID=324767 RepID=UPI003CE845F8